MAIIYNIKVLRMVANRHNDILMSLLLLVAQDKKQIKYHFLDKF